MPRTVSGAKRSRILAVRVGPVLWRRLVAEAYRREMTVPEVTRFRPRDTVI
jgi:hypothetical protein